MRTKTNLEQKAAGVSGLRSALMMVALGLPYFFSNFHRYALGIIGSVIAADYQLTPEQLGILGSALLYTYATMQIPCGYLADKISPKKMLVFSCILAAISSVMFASGSNFTSLVIARALTGVATALVYVPAMAIIRKSYGDAVYGSMVGIMVAMGKAGNVAAASPLKFFTDIVGWKATFRGIGAISIVIAVLAWFLIIETKAEREAMKEKRRTAQKADLSGLRSAGAITIMVGFFLVAGTRLSFQSLWAGKYFTEGIGGTDAQSGYYLTMMSVGCIFGSLIFGKLSDAIGSMRALVICSLVFSASWLMFMLIPVGATGVFVHIASAILGAVGAGTFTVCFSCVRSFVSAGGTGLSSGIFNFFAFFGSAMFTQFSTKIFGLSNGTVKDQFNVLLLVFTVITLIAALVVAAANRKKIAEEKNR